MLSTNPAIGEKNIPMNKKRSIKNIFIFVFDKFEPVTSVFFYLALNSASSALDPSAILAHWSIGLQNIKIQDTRYKIQETLFSVGYSTTNNISYKSYFPT